MLAILPEAFSSKKKRQEEDQQALIEELYKQIGQLKVENEFLKKNVLRRSVKSRKLGLDPGHSA